jgi:phytol kinase
MQQPFPTITDLAILAVAFTWVLAVLLIGEGLRRLRDYPPAMTRKFIHLFAGFSVFTIPFYTHSWAAIIVAVSFVILIFLASPKSPIKSLKRMFEVMAREEDYLSGHIWGPFLYAISITVLVSLFTLIPTLTPFFVLAAMALTAMYLGDGIAPIVGAKFGKHKYTIGKSTRSIEGSIALFLASFAGGWVCWIVLDFYATGGFSIFNIAQIAILGLICAFVATLIEGISPAGVDNITVPLLTAMIIFGCALMILPPMLSMIMFP